MMQDVSFLEWLIAFIVGVCFSGTVGGLIGFAVNGRDGAGIVLGALLGPIGWLIILFLADQRRRCQSCRGVLHQEATVCPHCRASQSAGIIARKASGTFCSRCNVDGIATTELGVVVYRCPKCGTTL